jgi:hypothetical protein
VTFDRTRSTVLLLAAQALSFGIAEALLLIPANGIFLDAFGARWLPVTYVGIAALGSAASLAIARSLRRWTLPAVAVVILGAAAAIILATWLVIVVTGDAWPSVVQLLMFPIMIQLGFVIIGGQAGRLLDLQQIKGSFPKIVSGFVVGFTLGGFGGAPLLDVLGAPEHLVAVSAVSFVVFLLLVRLAARRRGAELANVERPSDDRPRPPLREVLTGRLVVLVFVYQLLSAMGSQVLDFLAFDRAAARYDDAGDLTRFVSIYTGVLNLADLLFLGLAASWLLRRYGLRLGLVANPAAITVLAAAMVVGSVGPGAASLTLFTVVAATRVVDIALTDGTTRTSINAVYQVMPVEERMAVQASVEGIGVPVAMGATGVLLLGFDALDLGTGAIAAFALVLCGAWSVAAFVVYGDYRRSIADRLRRRGLDLDTVPTGSPEEQTAVRRLLLTDDVRDVRLGLDLSVTANVASADLARLAGHEDRDVRLLALGRLARRGDPDAAALAGEAARRLAASDDVGERRAAALALADIHPTDRDALLRTLLADEDATVRIAALDAVSTEDDELVDVVADRLGDADTIDAVQGALGRLGAPALALAVDRVATGHAGSPRLVRLLATIDTTGAHAARLLVPLVTHRDRTVSLAALTGLARHRAPVDTAVLDLVQADDARLAACALAASASMVAGDECVVRALDDVVRDVAARVIAVLAVRHGVERLEGARAALASPDAARRALGVEMLQVSLPRSEAALAGAVLRDDVPPSERLRRLHTVATAPARDRAGWLADLVLDPDGRWDSPWLRAVALDAEARTDRSTAARHAAVLDGELAGAAGRALAEMMVAVSR